MLSYITIDTLQTEELAIYTNLTESQLKHYYEPKPGLFICESPKVIRRALDAGYKPHSILFEPQHLTGEGKDILERCSDIPAYMASPEILVKLTGYNLTSGMLCAMYRKELPDAETICNGTSRIAVLYDVENPTNVGAIFRSAAALKMEAVILTRGCADPLYRRAARVSMGNVFLIPWTVIEDINDLKRLGYKTAALALTDDSVAIDAPELKAAEKLAVVLGNEGHGLPDDAIKDSDYVVKIPMTEGVDSLNVAAASAVAFWELTQKC